MFVDFDGGPEEVSLVPLPPQEDLPPGPTWRCSCCGTRVRSGQPHTAVEPRPHQTFGALTTWAR